MSARRKTWGAWVRDHRKAAGMTRRKLAQLARIDPSYVTLIEKDGYVPKDDKVYSIGKLFGNTAMALLTAGYLPEDYSPKEVQDALSERRDLKRYARLAPEAQALIRALDEATPALQRQVMSVVRAMLPPKLKAVSS